MQRARSELSEVGKSDMQDWWLVAATVVAFVAAITLLVYVGVEWMAGM